MKRVIRRLILLVCVLRLVTPISAFAQTLGLSDPKAPNATYIETITFCQSDFNIDVSSDGLTHIIPVSAGYSFKEDDNPGLPLFSYIIIETEVINGTESEIVITSLSGNREKTIKVNSTGLSCDVSSLPSGIHMVSLYVDGQLHDTCRLIKQ